MQTIESIRRTIKSSEDLRDIVRTMRTLSAVNIHHFEQAVESVGEYYKSVEMGLRAVLRGGRVTALESEKSEDSGVYYIIFGSDQGLCGGFNDQIVEYSIGEMKKNKGPDKKDVVICAGERVFASIEGKIEKVAEIFSIPRALSGVTPIVQQTVLNITELQAKGMISRVVLFHHKLLSQVSYQPRSVTLLPIDREWINAIQQKEWPTRALPAFTMDSDALFSALFRQYIFVSLYRAFAESMACENAARLVSMQSAEKNIDERLENLNALYRSERQSSITSELLDIVSGFEALRDNL